MSQITVRAPDELIQRVKACATEAGKSMNEYVTLLLDAATDADLAGSEAERIRERLARAGLLAAQQDGAIAPPDPHLVAAAAARAARGTPLSDLVTEGR